MATGDASDFADRLAGVLPPGWFGDDTPVLDAVLAGPAAALALVYAILAYVQAQTRIGTATDGWLDLIAADFLGDSLTRRTGESDTAYRARILANLLRERATRAGMVTTLTTLTGRAPEIFEPARPQDTGGYGIACGYGARYGYGSLVHPCQVFLTAYRPTGAGIVSVAGYGGTTGAYSTPSRAQYASLDMIADHVADSDIYAAIAATRPAGIQVWARIES
jgi:hypothetical protein